MAKVLSDSRIELSRQVFVLENKRKVLRAKLRRDYPSYPPKDRVDEIRKISFKITQISKHINSKLQDRFPCY